MAFLDYANEVKGHIPEIDILLCQILINRAWNDIKDARLWSWLRGFGVLLAPQIIFSGTVTATQLSNTVTLDATASAALQNLTNPLITQRQIRIGQGPMYNIAAYDQNVTLTLDRLYMEKSGSGQPYQVYRCYFQPTDQNGAVTSDFSTYRAILNPVEGYAIVGENLRLTRGELDARDPTRGAQDLAYTLSSFTVDANGIPFFEMWPHPTTQRSYLGLYQKRGPALSLTQDIPATMNKDILIEKSLDYACDWAVKNVSRFPALKGVDWKLEKAEHERHYQQKLKDARRHDDEIFLDSFLPQLRDYLRFPPIDSRFMQSHDVGAYFS